MDLIYRVRDEDGFVYAIFAFLDDARDYADMYGFEVVVPSREVDNG